jgi:predicted Rossmann fold nucleotide-binding protein DprA/Smf involved in DNA uptake
LLKILANEPLHLDEIARTSSLKIGTVSAKLAVMELKGLVKSIGSGVYQRE